MFCEIRRQNRISRKGAKVPRSLQNFAALRLCVRLHSLFTKHGEAEYASTEAEARRCANGSSAETPAPPSIRSGPTATDGTFTVQDNTNTLLNVLVNDTGAGRTHGVFATINVQ
jgi:hypothetical protein